MMPKNDDDVRKTFSIFGQHITKSLTELDVSLLKFSIDILKSLIRPDKGYVVTLCCVIILLNFSLILVNLLKMLTLNRLLVS